MLAIVFHVEPPSVDDSQFKILPTFPVNVNVPVPVFPQNKAPPLSSPETVGNSTLIISIPVLSIVQLPL